MKDAKGGMHITEAQGPVVDELESDAEGGVVAAGKGK